MLRETETDRTADSDKQISPEHQQVSEPVEDEPDQWKQASLNNSVMINLKKIVNLMGHAVYEQAKIAEKQIKQLKRF